MQKLKLAANLLMGAFGGGLLGVVFSLNGLNLLGHWNLNSILMAIGFSIILVFLGFKYCDYFQKFTVILLIFILLSIFDGEFDGPDDNRSIGSIGASISLVGYGIGILFMLPVGIIFQERAFSAISLVLILQFCIVGYFAREPKPNNQRALVEPTKTQ